MKKLRATSLCLVFALMLGIGSSCANLPGSTVDTNTAPPAADIPVTEEEIVTNPVDLSWLTKEELGKIKYGLLDDLQNANKDDEFHVVLFLKDPLPDSEFEILLEKKLSGTAILSDEHLSELDSLSEKANDTSLSENEKASLSQQITDLEKQLDENVSESNRVYQKAVNEVIAETNGKVMQAFITEHNIEIIHDYFIADASMLIGPVTVSAQKIIEMANDDRLHSLEKSTVSPEEIIAAYKMMPVSKDA